LAGAVHNGMVTARSVLRTRAGRLVILVVLAVGDIALSLHATLSRAPRQAASAPVAATGAIRPTDASLGEVLGWGTSFLLLLVIAVVITDAVWVARGKKIGA
jgi:hypothetical protein